MAPMHDTGARQSLHIVAVNESRGPRFRKPQLSDCDVMIPEKEVCRQHWTCSQTLYDSGARQSLRIVGNS